MIPWDFAEVKGFALTVCANSSLACSRNCTTVEDYFVGDNPCPRLLAELLALGLGTLPAKA